jgi:hypothetical protein
MRLFHLLPTLKISTLCLAAISPVLSQDSIPVYPIVDFEGKQIRSTLGAYGGYFADNLEYANDSVTTGNSEITLLGEHEVPDSSLWVPGHNEESAWALHLGYKLGTVLLGCGGTCTYAPHVGVSIGFSDVNDPIELSGATHLTFWAKGRDSLTVNVAVLMRDSVKRPADYSQTFTIDTTWKKYSIKLEPSTDFKLPDWVAPMPFDVVRVNGIAFGINKGENPIHVENALFLDDIVIVNWVYSLVSGIFKQNHDAGRLNGLRAHMTGNIAVVRLPAAMLGKTGVIEALDASGRKVGQAAFGPHALDVSLTLAGASAKSAGLYFRALPK